MDDVIEQEALDALADAALGPDTPAEAFILGYRAGRTREPTAVEIEAAGRAMAANASWVENEDDVDIEFSQWRRDGYLRNAKAALEAARKAVKS